LNTPDERNLKRVRLFRVLKVGGGVFAVLVVIGLLAGPIGLSAPSSCRVCHVAAAASDQLQKTAHASVACQDCHTDRGVAAGLGNSLALVGDAWRTIAPASSSGIAVHDEACRGCHGEIGREVPFVKRGLRMSHAGLEEAGYQCTECHAGTAHQVSADRLDGPRMSVCATCHNNVNQSGKCELCHVEQGSAEEAKRSDPEWSKTHGPNWRDTHGMGDLATCTLCHDKEKCRKCHGVPLPHGDNFIPVHGEQAAQYEDECFSCHKQAFCFSCHGMQMPHPDGFLKIHSTQTTGTDDPRCVKCHVADNCDECHVTHTHPGGAGE